MSETAPAPMTLEIEDRGAYAVVRCHGKLLWGSTDLLYLPVASLLADKKDILLDLGDLTQMDSMGLGTLVRLAASATTRGRTLELRHLSKKVRELLILTNLLPVFAQVGEHGLKL